MNNENELQIRPLETIESEINFYKQQTAIGILEIGKRLIEAKEQLPHGEWGKWLEEKVEFTQETASRFMRCSKEYNSNLISTSNLGTNKLFALLSVPQEEREEFISKPHEVNGQTKTVDEMTTRELQQAIKEKKQSNKTANAKPDKIVDDEQRLQQVILEREKLEDQLKLKQQQTKEIKEKILMNKKSLNLEVKFEEVLEDDILGRKTLYYNIYLARNLGGKELVLKRVRYSFFGDIDINESFDCIISPIKKNINFLEYEKDFVIGQCLNFKDTAIKRGEEIYSQSSSYYDNLQDEFDKINEEFNRRKMQSDDIKTWVNDENKLILKKFYKVLAKSFHPDKGGSHEEMQLVNLLKQVWGV